MPVFDRCPLSRTIDLALVMEPTDNAIQVGCLGNLDARVTVHGAAAHSARPWLGENAIHTAIRALVRSPIFRSATWRSTGSSTVRW